MSFTPSVISRVKSDFIEMQFSIELHSSVHGEKSILSTLFVIDTKVALNPLLDYMYAFDSYLFNMYIRILWKVSYRI